MKDIIITYKKELLNKIYNNLYNIFFEAWENNWINSEYELKLFETDVKTIKTINKKRFMIINWQDNTGFYFEHDKFKLYLKEFLFNLDDYAHIFKFESPSAEALWSQIAKNNFYLFIAACKADTQFIINEAAEEMLLGYVEFIRQLVETQNLNVIPL